MERSKERELTEPVDLAAADGRTLNPAARGWSRHPLHRANLRGGWGRTKRWDYWAILAGDLVISSVYADVDYVGLADVWWVDLATGRTGGRGIVAPLARGIGLPDISATVPLRCSGRHLQLDISDDAAGTTRLRGRWDERDGTPAHLNAAISLPPGDESMNVVIPWSDRRFQFTSKHQARPATGELVVGDAHRSFGQTDTTAGAEAWGVLDVGRGRWPYRTRWNWGGGAGRIADGRVVGIQIGGRWTEGTGATENGIIVDGVLHKIGTELRWEYRWDEPMHPWRVEDPDGRLRLELEPRFDKHSKIEAGAMGTETHQVFGRWSGTFVTDGGGPIELSDIQGFAEESRSRW
jgi:hypothetical protein